MTELDVLTSRDRADRVAYAPNLPGDGTEAPCFACFGIIEAGHAEVSAPPEEEA